MFSIFNILVFVVLILSGSRTYIALFVLRNIFVVIKQYGRVSIIDPILAGLLIVGGTSFFHNINDASSHS